MKNNKTIEEAAEYYVKMQYIMGVEKEYPIADFKAGAEWQKQRMYSEEELMSIIDSFIDNLQDYSPTFNSRQEWFEQFKKK
jgi:hypothetical protein